MTPAAVDALWKRATREAPARERPVLYVFAELLQSDVRAQALREGARDALEAAVQRAAADLPDGYRVELDVERGAGTVRLHFPCGAFAVMDRGGNLAAEVDEALEAARQERAR